MKFQEEPSSLVVFFLIPILTTFFSLLHGIISGEWLVPIGLGATWAIFYGIMFVYAWHESKKPQPAERHFNNAEIKKMMEEKGFHFSEKDD